MYKSSNDVPPLAIASCITSVAKSMIDAIFFFDNILNTVDATKLPAAMICITASVTCPGSIPTVG